MPSFIRNLWKRNTQPKLDGGLVFSRPLVILQSDDWGRVGVRDQEGSDELRAAGLMLGESPYDSYTLETADNLAALRELLLRHRDSVGRPACMVMNFITANLDFPRMAADDFRNIHLKPLAEGLPGAWKRPGLLGAYRQGTSDGVFHPALHGLTHFCRPAAEQQLTGHDHRFDLLRSLWKAETPYIHWRMPWVGYEYWSPERKPVERFLSAELQEQLIRQAVENFKAMFGTSPSTACAPGYRANENTRRAWAQHGIRVAQNGAGSSTPCHLDENEMLQLYRNLDFDPATAPQFSVEECLRVADESLANHMPLIVSLHSINFHSTIRDFCGPTLAALDRFLSALERKYPDLLYVHDADLYQGVTRGSFDGPHGTITVTVKQSTNAAPITEKRGPR